MLVGHENGNSKEMTHAKHAGCNRPFNGYVQDFSNQRANMAVFTVFWLNIVNTCCLESSCFSIIVDGKKTPLLNWVSQQKFYSLAAGCGINSMWPIFKI